VHPETLASALWSAGNLLLGLERSLALHDQSAYDRLTQEVTRMNISLVSQTVPLLPGIEISQLTVSGLKDVGEPSPTATPPVS
jgi:hypothetical protein